MDLTNLLFQRLDEMDKTLAQIQLRMEIQQHLMLANCQLLTPEQRTQEFAAYQNAMSAIQNAIPDNMIK